MSPVAKCSQAKDSWESDRRSVSSSACARKSASSKFPSLSPLPPPQKPCDHWAALSRPRSCSTCKRSYTLCEHMMHEVSTAKQEQSLRGLLPKANLPCGLDTKQKCQPRVSHQGSHPLPDQGMQVPSQRWRLTLKKAHDHIPPCKTLPSHYERCSLCSLP